MRNESIQILVPIDGSQASLDAVRYTAGVFPPDRTSVALLYIFSKVPESLFDLASGNRFRDAVRDLVGWEMRIRVSIESFMEEAKGVLLAGGFPQSTVIASVQDLRIGIARDILAESHKGYHAVVCGRTGAGRFEGFAVGSVAKKLLDRTNRIPLCLVGDNSDCGKILVGVDGSEGSFGAVDFIASNLSNVSQIMLFHALRGLNVYERRHDGTVEVDYEQEWLATYEIKEVFERARERLISAGTSESAVSTRIAKGVASRAGAIAAEAKEGAFGTLVLGRRGHSNVEDFSMGRVTDKVVQMALDRAVWIVP